MYGTKKFRRLEDSYLISTQITNHRTLPYDNVGCKHCQKISLGFQICEGIITYLLFLKIAGQKSENKISILERI